MIDSEGPWSRPEFQQAIHLFRQAWAEGQPPDVEPFAARHGDLAELLERELVVVNFECLLRAGGDLPIEAYLAKEPFQRFKEDPEIVPALIAVEVEFMLAIPDRSAFLRRFPGFEDDVHAILDAHEIEPGALLGTSSIVHGARPGRSPEGEPVEEPGSRVRPGAEISFLERLEVGDRIGRGGFKRVYRALQIATGRGVALKAPRAQAGSDSLRGEALILARLDHQNIPSVIALDDPGQGDEPIFVEKLARGRSWSDRLTEGRAKVLDAEPGRREALWRDTLIGDLGILQTVAQALQHAHGLGLIHGDIKPANVMVSEVNGLVDEVYLIDWGQSMQVGTVADPGLPAVHRDDIAAAPGCTRAYMAPEMALGLVRRYSSRTDVFLLGAVLYEMLSDVPPYGHFGAGCGVESGMRAFSRAVMAQIPHPDTIQGSSLYSKTWKVPAELAELALRSMSLKPDDRPSDAGEFARAIAAFLKHAQAEAQAEVASYRLGEIKGRLASRRIPRHLLAAEITPLIEVANQFRRCAEVYQPVEGAPNSPRSLTPVELEGRVRMHRDEAQARDQLIALAEKAGDYALASAQLDELATLPEGIAADLTTRRRRIKVADIRRRRVRAALAVTTIAAIVLLFVSGYFFVESERASSRETIASLNEKTTRTEAAYKSRLAALEQLRAVERARLLTLFDEQGNRATQEAFDQGAAAYLSEPLRLLADKGGSKVSARLARRGELLGRALVPVATSSRRLSIGCLSLSPDGRLLASGDLSGEAVRVWDVASGEMIHVFKGHSRPAQPKAFSSIPSLTFCPDRPGELLSSGLDGTIRVWDLALGAEKTRVLLDSGQILSMDAISNAKGGCLALAATSAGTLESFELAGNFRAIRKVVAGHASRITAVRLRPGDGGMAASASDDGTIRLWDASGGLMGILEPPKPDAAGASPFLNDLAFSADGRLLAAARKDGLVFVWDVDTKALVATLKDHEAGRDGRRFASRVVFGADGALFSTGSDGTAREWDTRTGRMVAIRARHDIDAYGQSDVRPLSVSADGQTLATAGSDGRLRVWDRSTGRLRLELEGLEKQLTLYSYSAGAIFPETDLAIAAGGARDAFLRAFDTRTLRERRTFTDGMKLRREDDVNDLPVAVAIGPKGERFASATVRGDLSVWEVATGRRVAFVEQTHTFPNDPRFAGIVLKPAVVGLAFSGNGERLATIGMDHRVRLWNASNGERLFEWADDDPESVPEPTIVGLSPLEPTAYVVRFDLDDRHLIMAGRDGVIRVREAETGKITQRLRGHTQLVSATAFGLGGLVLATGSEDGVIFLWDWKTRRPIRTFELPPLMDGRRFGPPTSKPAKITPGRPAGSRYRQISGLAFSSDGRLLAAAQVDGTVSLIDLAGDIPIHRGIAHEPLKPPYGVIDLAFARDGGLITAGADGTVRRLELLGPGPIEWQVEARSARSMVPSLDGSEWLVVNGLMGLERWGGETFKPVTGWPAEPVIQSTALATVPGSDLIVVTTAGGKAVVIDHAEGKIRATFQPPATRRPFSFAPNQPISMTTVAVDSSGKRAATNRSGAEVDLWSVADGSLIKTLVAPGRASRAHRLAFRPTGPAQLAASDEAGRLVVWDVDTGKPVFEPLQGPVNQSTASALAYSPDGRRLVQGGTTGEIVVWEAETGRKVQTLDGPRPLSLRIGVSLQLVYDACFSPDGRWLATCGNDAAVRLWDARNPDQYVPLATISTLQIRSYRFFGRPRPGADPLDRTTRDAGIRALAFSRDGRRLLAADWESPLHVIDLESVLADRETTGADLADQAGRRAGVRLRDLDLELIERNRLVPPPSSEAKP